MNVSSTDNTGESRNILVTGASSGIGRAVAKKLVAEQHRVIGVARDFTKFGEIPENLMPESVDLEDIKKLPENLKRLQQRHGNVDALVLCAGRGQFGSLEEFSYQQIDSLMNLNFTSQAYVVRAFLPPFKARKKGDIIIIGSEAALSGGRRGAIYCASKFALRGMAQALRDECARSNVRVTMVNPGMVKTEFYDDLPFSHGDAEENYLLPEDIADAVSLVLTLRGGSVVDEINLSPLKKVLNFTKPK